MRKTCPQGVLLDWDMAWLVWFDIRVLPLLGIHDLNAYEGTGQGSSRISEIKPHVKCPSGSFRIFLTPPFRRLYSEALSKIRLYLIVISPRRKNPPTSSWETWVAVLRKRTKVDRTSRAGLRPTDGMSRIQCPDQFLGLLPLDIRFRFSGQEYSEDGR